jgi:hypothetical protein
MQNQTLNTELGQYHYPNSVILMKKSILKSTASALDVLSIDTTKVIISTEKQNIITAYTPTGITMPDNY